MACDLELVGRQSSHYTRVTRIFAHELGLTPRLRPIHQLMSLDSQQFADNPALKLPILSVAGKPLFGTLNICRQLAELAGASDTIFWPEDARGLLLMNAHELVAHAMAVQVEIVAHEFIEKRPADGVSSKRRQSLRGTLRWLDAHWSSIHAAIPTGTLSYLETSLFCLLSHLPFRNPIDIDGLAHLKAFADAFGRRESAIATPYQFDPPSS